MPKRRHRYCRIYGGASTQEAIRELMVKTSPSFDRKPALVAKKERENAEKDVLIVDEIPMPTPTKVIYGAEIKATI